MLLVLLGVSPVDQWRPHVFVIFISSPISQQRYHPFRPPTKAVSIPSPNEGIIQSMCELCDRILLAQLTEKEARQALYQHLLPKLEYKMRLTSLTKKQCQPINTMNRQAISPSMRLNRNMPDAVVFGTVNHGGMEFPEAYALPDQLQITDIIRQVR